MPARKRRPLSKKTQRGRSLKGRSPAFRSKFEETIASTLRVAGVKFDYETVTVTYQKEVRGSECQACGSTDVYTTAKYTPDFILANGIFIEAKGKFTPRDRTKILAVLRSNNEINRDNFRILFMYDNWLTKKKLKRYTDWCAQHDIQCAVGTEVPEEWTKKN